MKRFFPLLLGLTLICFSFTLENKSSCVDADKAAVNTLLKICEFHPNSLGSTSQCPGMPAEMTINSNCEGLVVATVTVTNLAQSPSQGVKYYLPTGVPDIYVETEANGVIQVSNAITDFFFKGEYRKVGATNYPIFEHDVDLDFDVFSGCNQGSTSLFFDAKITEQNGSLYPVLNHSDSDGIFYDAIFDVSPPDYYIEACAESCYGCLGTRMVKYGTTEVISSNSLAQDGLNNGIVTSEISNIEDLLSKELAFEISPNPFTEDINISFNQPIDTRTKVEIIDSHGRSVYSNEYFGIKTGVLKFESDYLQAGLYYCKIVSGGKILTKKLVKY